MRDTNNLLKLQKKPGILIACEGLSGCGKSESIKELHHYLKHSGYNVHIIEWNSNEKIRGFIKLLQRYKILSPFVYSLLQWVSFINDYFKQIRPLLKTECIIIADRYVYTGITRDKANGSISCIGKTIEKIIRVPDLIFLFDTDPEICMKRIHDRNKELFHPNKKMKKDASYLKAIRTQYYACFDRLQINKKTILIRIFNNHCNMNEHVRDYIEQKLTYQGRINHYA